MAPSPPAAIRLGSWLPLLLPLSLSLHWQFLLALLTLPSCHCRSLEQPEAGSSSSGGARLQEAWDTALVVLLPAVVLLTLGVAASCFLWRVLRKIWGGGKPHLRSVNAGMTRSDPVVPAPNKDADGGPTADGPGQLGCARRGQHDPTAHGSSSGGTKVMRAFDYDMLAAAAEGFSGSRSSKLELGRSSSGTMYRGTMVSDEGLEIGVAIKLFHHRFKEEAIQYVSEDLKCKPLRHRNLLCPLGYCMRQRKLLVVYEYMVNRSLDEQIFAPNHEVLSWARRCRIITGIAEGLHHLHSHGSVHGALKASNVLLDPDMGARLGDFGYSRTVGSISFKDSPYLAQECWNETGVSIEPTLEMDVFYLGAVILEAVCGRRVYNTRAPNSGFWFLADWVGKQYGEGHVLEAVDAALAGDFNKAEPLRRPHQFAAPARSTAPHQPPRLHGLPRQSPLAAVSHRVAAPPLPAGSRTSTCSCRARRATATASWVGAALAATSSEGCAFAADAWASARIRCPLSTSSYSPRRQAKHTDEVDGSRTRP